MQIVKVKITDLTPYENNAKQHPRKQIEEIKNSIKTFGFCDPVGIWGENNIIVEGHGRVLALTEMGETEVDCIRLDHLTDEERRAYTLAHNKTTLSSDFDFEILEAELEQLSALNLNFSMADFGFDELESEEQKEIVEDEAPEVDEQNEPITKLGDIWQLGRHRLMCGDSTDKATVEMLMNGNKADMVFTDPPYGNGTSGKYGRGQLGVRTIKGDENLDVFTKVIESLEFEKIVYFLQWRTLAESLEAINEKGLKINTVAVWDKKNAGLNGAGGISEQWEAIIFAGNIKYKKFGGNVFTVAREQHRREDSPHPHQKPIKLLAEIFDFIDECKSVFDPFGGSGSTLIACEQLDRTCYMMELDPKYCDVIVKRWETLTGQTAILLNN
jgi:site-specific DNA-methyltransferase (adenine-specific)